LTDKKPKKEAPLVFDVFVEIPGDPRGFVIEFGRGLEVSGSSFANFINGVCPDGERVIGGIDGSAGCAAMTVEALETEARGAWEIFPEDAWRLDDLGM